MDKEKIENFKLVYFLKSISSLGDVRINRILQNYTSLNHLMNDDLLKLQSIEGITEKICYEIEKTLIKISDFENAFEKQINLMMQRNIKVTTLLDNDYPLNLLNIYDAPAILYYFGNLKENDRYSIGIVGTRTPSDYGRKVCLEITTELCRKGIPIISGLAIGVDSIAHKACLDNRGLTYAVLGSGVDNLYPPDNRILYEKIINEGVIISEFDIGSKAEKVNFPRRNRIISGISLGTLIIESAAKGGSLITAEFALDQNRELYAIPGNIYSRNSEGCNNLIKKGYAKLVTNVDDILSELNYKITDLIESEKKSEIGKENLDLNIFENKIYNVLNDNEPVNIDKICELTGFTISDCLVNLLTMEFKGIVSQLPGKYFIKL